MTNLYLNLYVALQLPNITPFPSNISLFQDISNFRFPINHNVKLKRKSTFEEVPFVRIATGDRYKSFVKKSCVEEAALPVKIIFSERLQVK